ncbi:alpha/beta hydrolase [Siccationidurans ginsengisoli]|nr:alpha/beta hydrolase [Hymenobacter sp. BT559]
MDESSQEVLAAYRQLVTENAHRKLLIDGGSVGSYYVVNTILQARDAHLKLPVAAAISTPSTDATGAGDSYVANDGRDLLVWKNFTQRLTTDHVIVSPGTGLTKPSVSLIQADYSKGFVPSVIATGTRDLFPSNSVRLHQALKTVHVSAELLVFEGMWHGFNATPDLPEAEACTTQALDFLTKYIN